MMESIEGQNRQDTKAIIVNKGDCSYDPAKKYDQNDQYNFYCYIPVTSLCFINANLAYDRNQERP